MARKIILKSFLSPGDVVMLTAAVRDLHLNNPGVFETDVRTTAMPLWDHNPFLTALSEDAQGIKSLDCHYPLINRSNQTPYHFIHGFQQFLGEKLGVPVNPTAFKGDVHLSPEERNQCSQVKEILGRDVPFWIVVAGGKTDYTIKWWHPDRYQEVVAHFKNRILFVQVGESGHRHPKLEGALDLRGKTSIRQFVRLMHHAQGVLCPVTFAMHLAAAVESRSDAPKNRPCVVVAGGREPVHWEAYSHHRFLHTQGALTCCQLGGCWRSRTVPLGDGDSKDEPKSLCVDVVRDLPRCMDMITSKMVIEAIESYFEGGVISYMDPKNARHLDLSAASQRAKKENDGRKRSTTSGICRNRVCLRLLGLRRSGIHPVLSWLAGLYEGGVCFVNDINHQPRIRPNHAGDELPGIDGSFNHTVSLQDTKNLLLLCYEDERLVHLRDNPPDEDIYGLSGQFREILLLRDPFNTFASRLHLMRRERHNAFVKDFLLPDEAGVPQLAQRWKFLAEEFIGKTSHLGDQKLTINYNRWVTRSEYRASLCDLLAVPLREPLWEEVPHYGFGSSFDGKKFDRRASEMQVNRRWEYFREDPEFLTLVGDPDLWALSEQIFGEDLDHNEIRHSLGFSREV